MEPTPRQASPEPQTDYCGPWLTGDRKLKVWLAEPVFQALSRVAVEHDLLRPVLARRIFFVHLFGREQLRQLDDWIAREAPYSEIMYSRRSVDRSAEPRMPLGKRAKDAVILMSNDLHDGLSQMAARHKLPVGTYAAHVLSWTMFGRGVHAGLAMKVSRGRWLDENGERWGEDDP